MIKIIKISLIVLVVISGLILGILFLQDRTRKLEDRKYKEINKINVSSDTSNINFYKSEDEQIRVVVYGSNKDKVEIIEGTKSLIINKETGSKTCLLNCKNEINIYVPEDFENIEINSETGNINVEKVTIKNIKIDSDLGNINIFKTENVNITSNTGNVNINILKATNNSNIKTDVGNVYITNISNLKLETKSETGSVIKPVIKEEQEFTLKIETNVGNIDINHYDNKS